MPKTINVRFPDGVVRRVTASDEVLAHWRRERQDKLRELADQIDPSPQQDPEFDRKIRKRMKETGGTYADTAVELAEEYGERHAQREARLSDSSASGANLQTNPDEFDHRIRAELDRRGLDMSHYADVAVELASGNAARDTSAVELAGFAGMGRTNYAPREWVKACVVHLEPAYKEPIDTTKHMFPVRKPDGELSLEAMKEAEKRLLAGDGLAPEVQRQAARELVGAYRLVNDNPSDALKALAGINYYGLSEDGDAEDGDRTTPVESSYPFTVEEAHERAERDGTSFADACQALTIERSS